MVLAHNIEDTFRTQDVRIAQNVTFDSMLLSANVLEGLKSSGFHKPSPIQLHAIPLGKCGFDLLLEAKSGTGKTAVFTVICLEKLNLSKGLQAMILAPTREIAAQIYDVINQIGSCYKGLNVAVVMGGLPVREDILKFSNNNVHIVVGSPGRLRQLVQEKHVDVSSIRLLILDEADKLLTKTFLPDINYIYSLLPQEKQVIMSSATYTEESREFIKIYVQSAQHVCPETTNILLGISQKVTTVKQHSNIVKQTKLRFEELLKVLTKHSFKQCLIFCNYQVRITELHKMLKKENWPAEQLYGRQEQINRLGALKSLQEYKCRILISTDLAARGIDASNVDLVVNFEPPYQWQTYLHRIGRAGRYGSYGQAITILSEGQEKKRFIDMLKEIKAPLQLKNLWNDHLFLSTGDFVESPQSESRSESPKTEIAGKKDSIVNCMAHDDYTSLWAMLTSESYKENTAENETGTLLSFTSLCDDFKNENVESFSDLLTSLETHVLTKTATEIQNESAPDENKAKASQEDNHKNEPLKSKEQGIEANINNNSNISNGRDENIDLSSDDTLNSMEEALLKAGLPTAFGSSKHKNKPTSSFSKNTKNNTKRATYVNSVANTNYSANVHSDLDIQPNKLKSKLCEPRAIKEHNRASNYYKHSRFSKETYNNSLPPKSFSDTDSNSDSSQDEESLHNACKNTNKVNGQQKLNSSAHDFLNYHAGSDSKSYNKYNNCDWKNIASKRYHNSKHEKANTDNYYSIWYKSLKYRVEQVKLAVYIEEMSELYHKY